MFYNKDVIQNIFSWINPFDLYRYQTINKSCYDCFSSRKSLFFNKTTNVCVVHLIDINLNEYTDECLEITNAYPHLIPLMKRGDIIENIRDSGYGADGLYFYNGHKIIYMYRDLDVFGTPPKEFRIITGFDILYWYPQNTITNNLFVGESFNSKFFWYNDCTYHFISSEQFDLKNKVVKQLKYVTVEGIQAISEYIVFYHDNEKYILLLDEINYNFIRNDLDICVATEPPEYNKLVGDILKYAETTKYILY